MNDTLSEELDAVSAILMDGIDVREGSESGTTTISISLHPLTANEDERSYVSLTLEIAVGDGYPDVAPKVAVSPLQLERVPMSVCFTYSSCRRF